MTTINTRTTGPQAWKIALVPVAASLATLVVVNLPISTDTVTGQPATEATQAVPDQATVDLRAPVITQETLDGSSVGPQSAPDQATIDGLTPAITQEYVGGPWSSDIPRSPGIERATRVDPGAAAAVGLNPGAIDEIVGGTTRAVPAPDNFEARLEALARANESGTISTYYTGGPDSAVAVNARWEALAQAYESGGISNYYLPAATGEEPHVPMANNQVR